MKIITNRTPDRSMILENQLVNQYLPTPVVIGIRYALALAFVFFATYFTYSIPALRDATSLMPMLAATLAAALLGGFGPALVVVTLGGVAWLHMIAPLAYDASMTNEALIRLSIFIFVAVSVAYISTRKDLSIARRSDAKSFDTESVTSSPLELIGGSVWSLDVNSQKLQVSPELTQKLDLQIDSSSTSLSKYLTFVHPADRMAFSMQLIRCIEHALPINIPHRLCPQNGRELLVTLDAKPYLASGGSEHRFIGLVWEQKPTQLRAAS